MSNEALIHVRIDQKTKAKAEKIIRRLGMTHSDAVRMYYSQIIEEKGIPFRSHIPNDESLAAITEAKAGKLTKTSMAELKKIWDGEA